jgi:hypothetical protein
MEFKIHAKNTPYFYRVIFTINQYFNTHPPQLWRHKYINTSFLTIIIQLC